MKNIIPESMQAVIIREPHGALTVDRIPVPKPGPGQVLIRIAASPINPSDLGFLKGSYGFHKPFPIVPGFEGSGTVVASGPGLLPRLLLGRNVACSSIASENGTWAEYMVTKAASCFILSKKLSLEQGSSIIVNPLTAVAFFDIAKQSHHKTIINNAAAGALGRMILRMGKLNDICVINIVRRQEQVKLIQSIGGENILDSSDPDFCEDLYRVSAALKPTLILDPVGGDQTQILLDAAPKGSTALLYGSLSGKKLELSLKTLALDDKNVSGFFLPNWIAKKNILQLLHAARTVQKLAKNELSTHLQKRFPLSEITEAIDLYQSAPTAGKVLLVNEKSITN